jgi:tRNA 2-thiouridine synthesizing protein A
MSDIVDARGLSCPQPVILTRGKIKEMDKGSFTVIVDNETAKENVIRAAESRGWLAVNVEQDNDDWKITFKKD